MVVVLSVIYFLKYQSALCKVLGTGAKFPKCQSRFPSFVGDWEQFMM